MSLLPSDAVWLKPGQVARRAGVAVSTLHFYEQLGLIRSRRTSPNCSTRVVTNAILPFARA